jgi:hypothetical protein
MWSAELRAALQSARAREMFYQAWLIHSLHITYCAFLRASAPRDTGWPRTNGALWAPRIFARISKQLVGHNHAWGSPLYFR